jgi:hypothetical protein
MIAEASKYPVAVRVFISVSVSECVGIGSTGPLRRSSPLILSILPTLPNRLCTAFFLVAVIVHIFPAAMVTFRTSWFDCTGQQPLFLHVSDILTQDRNTASGPAVGA